MALKYNIQVFQNIIVSCENKKNTNRITFAGVRSIHPLQCVIAFGYTF